MQIYLGRGVVATIIIFLLFVELLFFGAKFFIETI